MRKRELQNIKKTLILGAAMTMVLNYASCGTDKSNDGNQGAVVTENIADDNSDIDNDGDAQSENRLDTEPSISADDFDVDTLPKTEVKYTNSDLFPDCIQGDQLNSLLVIYVSFTDGLDFDKDKFEDMFVGEYDSDHRLYSVSSYFKYNSYGKNLLDISFAYYDCDMTSEQAWHYVNDEDAYGNFYGNQFFFDIFSEMQKSGAIDTSDMDKDHDGYVDGVVFVFGDQETDGCHIYGSASGFTGLDDFVPDKTNPVLGRYLKTSYEKMAIPLKNAGRDGEYTRVLIHEVGHFFGLYDYYDVGGDYDNLIDTMGAFDMQSYDVGDWNSFSRLTCGWLQPYVITEDMDSVTLKLRSSSLYDDAVLIPTSEGWNGTAYDEYILIDVVGRSGANGFDWSIIEEEAEFSFDEVKNRNGGIRIIHVDGRLVQWCGDSYQLVEDLDAIDFSTADLEPVFTCSNGVEPVVEGVSKYYHLIDLIPSDGSSKLRINTPTNWSVFTFLTTNDYFGAGDEFSILTCSDAFPNGTLMNNGGTLDYKVTVDFYDEAAEEAVITITKMD